MGDTSVVRATAQISAVTVVARIAGFARWIVLGLALGTTYLGNVYQTANLIPNIVFEMVAGGLLGAVLVPTFIAEAAGGKQRVSEVASTLANALVLVSLPLVIAGVVFARPLMSALLIGVQDEAVRTKQIEIGAWFLRFFLPQIPLYMLGMVMQGILHAHRKFVWPAIGPLLSSLIVIATYLTFRAMGSGATVFDVSRAQLLVLAGGTTLGVFALTFCQLPSVLRLGIRWQPVLRRRDTVIRGAVRAGGWGAVYFAFLQLILVVAVVLANRVEGGVVAFWIANAFFELPNALIGLPVGLSLYPSLSEAFVRRDEASYSRLLTDGWRLAAFAAVPAGVGLYVLSGPATQALLGWTGSVRPELVAATLRGLAIGVPAWLLMATIVRALYARGATARPAVLNGLAFIVLIVVGVGGTLATQPKGTAAMSLVGTGVGLGWWAALIGGVVLLAKSAREWSPSSALRSLGWSGLRGVFVGAATWLVVRGLDDVAPPAVVLTAGLATGAAVVALTAVRSPELRTTLALLRGSGQTREHP